MKLFFKKSQIYILISNALITHVFIKDYYLKVLKSVRGHSLTFFLSYLSN